MPPLNFYFDESLAPGASLGLMQSDALPPSGTLFSPAVGQNFGSGTGANRYADFVAQLERGTGGLTTTVPTMPVGAGSTNGFRSQNRLNGRIPAGNWFLGIDVRSVTAVYTGRCRYLFRVFACSQADGGGARELVPARATATTTANIGTGGTTNNLEMNTTWADAEKILEDEFLVVTLAAHQVTNNSGTTAGQDVNWKLHPDCRLTIPDLLPMREFVGGVAI